MLLREILNLMPEAPAAVLQNEKPFGALGLLEGNTPEEICSFLADAKYLPKVNPKVAMLITTQESADLLTQAACGLCITAQPRQLFFHIHNFLANQEWYARKQSPTQLGSECEISPLSSIAKNNVVIGNHVKIEEFVVIRENTRIGDHTVIRAGAVIGGEGFEHKREAKHIFAVRHMGGVVIGNHVEIKYNTCVDRAVYPWDNTCIGDDCRIDNLVYIAHAVKLAPRVLVVANSGLAGRVTVEEDCWFGCGATVRNGLNIGKAARVSMSAAVTKNVAAGETVTGNFALPHNQFINQFKKSLNSAKD